MASAESGQSPNEGELENQKRFNLETTKWTTLNRNANNPRKSDKKAWISDKIG